MKAIDILTRGNFEDVYVFKDGKPIETMSKGKAILTIGDVEITDFWVHVDALGSLAACVYLK